MRAKREEQEQKECSDKVTCEHSESLNVVNSTGCSDTEESERNES